MGDVLEPIIKWVVALAGAALVIRALVAVAQRAQHHEDRADRAVEDLDAIRRFRKGERRWRDLPRDVRLRILRNRARRGDDS